MKEKLRGFRFFLSKLIFEIIFRKEPAQKLGGKINNEVSLWNSGHNRQRCYICNHDRLTNRISGSDGIFSGPLYYYKCPKCGNEQFSDGTSYKSLWTKLEEKRIVEDGKGKYRYILLLTWQWFALWAILILFTSIGIAIFASSLI